MPATAKAREARSRRLLSKNASAVAYELYVERGNQSGSELDDWTQAEEEALQAQEEASPTGWSRDAEQPQRVHGGRFKSGVQSGHRTGRL
jgi:hypothetical protein